MKPAKRLVLAFAMSVLIGTWLQPAAQATSAGCPIDGAPARHGVLLAGICTPTTSGNDSSDFATGHATVTKTITCGRAVDTNFTNLPVSGWDRRCGASPLLCYGIDPKTGARTQNPAFATYTVTRGRPGKVTTWCPGAPVPALTTAAIRQQVLRLLPRVQIGSAWPTRALVNAQTILWAITSPDRSLGTVRIVGREVALRIRFAEASWNFGDGASDTTTSPGKPYDSSEPCNTAQCPGYFGHTYTATGHVTITLRVGWQASYSLDGGASWDDVDAAPLTGPATSHQLELVQARGVLVPDP